MPRSCVSTCVIAAPTSDAGIPASASPEIRAKIAKVFAMADAKRRSASETIERYGLDQLDFDTASDVAKAFIVNPSPENFLRMVEIVEKLNFSHTPPTTSAIKEIAVRERLDNLTLPERLILLCMGDHKMKNGRRYTRDEIELRITEPFEKGLRKAFESLKAARLIDSNKSSGTQLTSLGWDVYQVLKDDD